MNYQKYEVDFVIENMCIGTEIVLIYKNKSYFISFLSDKPRTIGSILEFIKFDLLKHKQIGMYCINEINKIETIQKFGSPKELFENSKIEGNILKDIWNDAEISWIVGLITTDKIVNR